MIPFIIIACSIVCLLLVVSGVTIPIYKEHRDATGSVINHDTFMRKFIYKVSLSRNEIMRILQVANARDNLSCFYDSSQSILTFSAPLDHQRYLLQIDEYDSYCILKLENAARIVMRSSIPMKLNPFFVAKLQAEPVPFSENLF